MQRKNLINSPQIVEEDSTKNEWIRYWWPNVTLAIVATDSPISNLPPQIMERVKVDKKQEMYFPIFYTNDFWMLQESLMPINSTVEKLDIHLSFAPMSMWKFQLYVQFEESFKLQVNVMGMDPAEHDQMKV